MKKKLVLISIIMLFITTISYPTLGFNTEKTIITKNNQYLEIMNNPPVVVITYPEDKNITVNESHIWVSGYAEDYDDGIIQFSRDQTGRIFWNGYVMAIIPIKTFFNFSEEIELFKGYNNITYTADDGHDSGYDWINITYYVINHPPDPPQCAYDSNNDQLIIDGYDPDDDFFRYGIDWDSDGIFDEWTGYDYYPNVQIVNCMGRMGKVDVISEDELGELSDITSVRSKNNLLSNIQTIKIWFLERISYLINQYKK